MNKEYISGVIEDSMKKWVGKNYGTQEMENPSWDTYRLSNYIASALLRELKEMNEPKRYNLTLIFRNDCDLDKNKEKLAELIKKYGGDILSEKNEGTKNLAYKINGEKKGIFYYIDLDLPNGSSAKVSAELNNNFDDVLRYLMVKERR